MRLVQPQEIQQEVAQFIWNACSLKKNSFLSSVGKQDNSLFGIHWLEDDLYHIYSNTAGFVKFFMIRIWRIF